MRSPRLRPAIRGRPTCSRRLMRLPSSLNRLAVGSVADAADLYAHSVLPQAYPTKKCTHHSLTLCTSHLRQPPSTAGDVTADVSNDSRSNLSLLSGICLAEAPRSPAATYPSSLTGKLFCGSLPRSIVEEDDLDHCWYVATGEHPSHKTFRIKKKLAKKMRQNRPIPHWIRMRTDNTIRSLPYLPSLPFAFPVSFSFQSLMLFFFSSFSQVQRQAQTLASHKTRVLRAPYVSFLTALRH
ncbi:hypothetical protein BHE74_00007077 [Ensete ventricosum]|nr:hypothetical protein BHE74_00007077 [Ensete ventricosum]